MSDAALIQWQNVSFPSWICGFDSRAPLLFFRKVSLQLWSDNSKWNITIPNGILAILGKIKFYNSKWNIRKPCMQRRAWGCSQHEEIDFLLYGEVISFACKCEVTTPFVVLWIAIELYLEQLSCASVNCNYFTPYTIILLLEVHLKEKGHCNCFIPFWGFLHMRDCNCFAPRREKRTNTGAVFET